MKVYLGGPINGCTDAEAHGWRQGFVDSLPGFEFLDPMRRDYRGIEDSSFEEIVHGDLADIDECDVFLAYCWQASWGTAMEIHYAANSPKVPPVIVVIPEGTRVSPWLRYHSDALVHTLDEAAALLRSWK